MNKIKTIALALTFGTMTVACNEASKKTESATDATQTVATETTAGQAAIKAYLELKDALVESSMEKAKLAAEKLKTMFQENDIIEMQTASIIGTEDIEVQRAAFELISMAMYDEVKEQGSTVELYKQYCPMAFDDKGAFWLSDAKEIRNPYFGSMMLKCGAVQETIVANE